VAAAVRSAPELDPDTLIPPVSSEDDLWLELEPLSQSRIRRVASLDILADVAALDERRLDPTVIVRRRAGGGRRLGWATAAVVIGASLGFASTFVAIRSGELGIWPPTLRSSRDVLLGATPGAPAQSPPREGVVTDSPLADAKPSLIVRAQPFSPKAPHRGRR
jgi:hypothetical protein